MQVWNLLHAACWKHRIQKSRQMLIDGILLLQTINKQWFSVCMIVANICETLCCRKRPCDTVSVEILSPGAQLYEKLFEKACNRWMTLKVTQGHLAVCIVFCGVLKVNQFKRLNRCLMISVTMKKTFQHILVILFCIKNILMQFLHYCPKQWHSVSVWTFWRMQFWIMQYSAAVVCYLLLVVIGAVLIYSFNTYLSWDITEQAFY